MPVTFANTIDGNDIYAKRAECDAAGNTLSTTYATKSELPDGVPAVTSSDDGKVLKASYTGGTGSFSWETESGGGGTQVQSDWTESDNTEPSYIQNKPTVMGLVAGSNVTITEGVSSITIAATDTTYTAGTGISITNGAISNSDPLPAHTSTESGKVLGVDSNGGLGWVAQGGGGGGGSFTVSQLSTANKTFFSPDGSYTFIIINLANNEQFYPNGKFVSVCYGSDISCTGWTDTVQLVWKVNGSDVYYPLPSLSPNNGNVSMGSGIVMQGPNSNYAVTQIAIRLPGGYSSVNFDELRVAIGG